MILIFASIVSIVLALLHFVIYKTVASVFVLSSSGRIALGVVLFVFCLSFILASALTFFLDNGFVRVLYTISASWLGFATYLFLASCVYALVLFVMRIFGADHSMAWFGMLCLVLAVIVSVYGLIHARDMRVKEINVSLSGLPTSWQGKKAVWVSDIHLGAIYGQDFARDIVSKINDAHPDIVFIGGDVYDGTKVNESEIIKPFADLHPALGVYFITGNHEEFRDNGPYLTAVKSVGMHVLNNEMITIDGVQLIGVDDRDSIDAAKFQKFISGLNIDKNKPSILLKHQPSQLAIAADAGISMQISGHTHRAQIWPLNFFTTMIFKGYDYGLNKWGNMLEYTSSGVGTWGPPMRVGSDSEIVVLDLEKNI